MGGTRQIDWPVDDLDLTREYGLVSLTAKENHRAVLRIENDAAEYALKCVELTPGNLVFLQETLDFIQSRGFTNLPRILPTVNGERFVSSGARTYFLMEWLPGHESKFTDRNELIICAQLLGKLHRLTKGFYPYGNNWQERWSAKLKELSEIDCSHAAVLRKILPEVIRAGHKALRLLDDPEVVESFRQPAVVCHHDLSQRNFIISPRNEGFLIDFDYAKADTPMRDLAQFLARALKQNDWDSNLTTQLLSAYAQENPLSRGDLGAMLAFLHFPRSLWGFGGRLNKHTTKESIGELTKKVEESLVRQSHIARLSNLLGFDDIPYL